MRWEGERGEGITRDRRRREQRWLSQQLLLVPVGNVGLKVSLGEVATTTPQLVIVSGGGKEEGYQQDICVSIRSPTGFVFHFGAGGNLTPVLHVNYSVGRKPETLEKSPSWELVGLEPTRTDT